jgi:hypothetical protein
MSDTIYTYHCPDCCLTFGSYSPTDLESQGLIIPTVTDCPACDGELAHRIPCDEADGADITWVLQCAREYVLMQYEITILGPPDVATEDDLARIERVREILRRGLI